MKFAIEVQAIGLNPKRELILKDLFLEMIKGDQFLIEKYEEGEWTYVSLRCECKIIKVFVNGFFSPMVIDHDDFLTRYGSRIYAEPLKLNDTFEIEGHFRKAAPDAFEE